MDLAAWAPRLLFILGILIVWLAVLRYRSHQRKQEQRKKAEWRQHYEWQNRNPTPKNKR